MDWKEYARQVKEETLPRLEEIWRVVERANQLSADAAKAIDALKGKEIE